MGRERLDKRTALQYPPEDLALMRSVSAQAAQLIYVAAN
jgi:hypothetical protein